MSTPQRGQGPRRMNSNSTDIRPGGSSGFPPPRPEQQQQYRQQYNRDRNNSTGSRDTSGGSRENSGSRDNFGSRENSRRGNNYDDESDIEDAGPRRPSPAPRNQRPRNQGQQSSRANDGPSISMNLPFGIRVEGDRERGGTRTRGKVYVEETDGDGRRRERFERVFGGGNSSDSGFGTRLGPDGLRTEYGPAGFDFGSGGLRPGFTGLGPGASTVFGSRSSGGGFGFGAGGLGGFGIGRGFGGGGFGFGI
ncbi:hypothetical protein GQ53DRAFT_750982 [Thozetella sp. PMI_491]|nr:hypothetical protein GQ53DRAFT_750982 [Thozetella sp. PMI_491]